MGSRESLGIDVRGPVAPRGIRGQSLDHIKRRLRTLCEARPALRSGLKWYLMTEAGLVRLRRITPRHVISALRLGVKTRTMKLMTAVAIDCDQVRVKSHIRLFGLRAWPDVTVKLEGAGAQPRGGIAREIAFRTPHQDDGGATVRIPRIVAYDRAGGWMAEEAIDGSPPAPGARDAAIATWIESSAVSFYRRDAGAEPWSETVRRMQVSTEALHSALPADLVDRAGNGVWPTAICHNDLSLGNMLWSDDELYVVDWECVGRSAVACDLDNLGLERPAIWHACVRALDALTPPGGVRAGRVIEPRVQLVLAVAIRLASMRVRGAELIRYYGRTKMWRRKRAEAFYHHVLGTQQSVLDAVLTAATP